MTNPPRPFARVRDADALLATWNARRDREQALAFALKRLLPRPVAERIAVVDASAGTLELRCSTGAIAAVLRQQGPAIVAGLAREGWQFSGIRVRVQPRAEPPGPQKRQPPQWDRRARQPLAELSAGLPEGPLRKAIERLLRRQG